jgi:hypothetical protein
MGTDFPIQQGHMVHDLLLLLAAKDIASVSCCCMRWHFANIQTGPDIISSGFYVSTDDIFDDSKWSDAVYFEEVGFDQDVSGS